MGRWDLNLRPIYDDNEPSFGGGLTDELKRQLMLYQQNQQAGAEEERKLAMTPGVSMTKPPEAGPTVSAAPGIKLNLPPGITQAQPTVMPKPQYNHATGQLELPGAPEPTIDPTVTPLQQSLAALGPAYNPVKLSNGKTVYFDPNFARRSELTEKIGVAQNTAQAKAVEAAAARNRGLAEYKGLLDANPADTRLGKYIRSIPPDVWANNPTIRDNVLLNATKADPEEAFANQMARQNAQNEEYFKRLQATLAANRDRTIIQVGGENARAESRNRTQKEIADENNKTRVTGDSLRYDAAMHRVGRKGSSATGVAGLLQRRGAGGSAAPASAPVNVRTYIHAVAQEPAFRGAAPIAVQAEARVRRAAEILKENPNVSDDELVKQLKAEGFGGG